MATRFLALPVAFAYLAACTSTSVTPGTSGTEPGSGGTGNSGGQGSGGESGESGAGGVIAVGGAAGMAGGAGASPLDAGPDSFVPDPECAPHSSEFPDTGICVGTLPAGAGYAHGGAVAVCRSYGNELCTLAQMSTLYGAGYDQCMWGWIDAATPEGQRQALPNHDGVVGLCGQQQLNLRNGDGLLGNGFCCGEMEVRTPPETEPCPPNRELHGGVCIGILPAVYDFTFEAAAGICESYGEHLCTLEEMQIAYDAGFEACIWGYIDADLNGEHRVALPNHTEPTGPCGLQQLNLTVRNDLRNGFCCSAPTGT